MERNFILSESQLIELYDQAACVQAEVLTLAEMAQEVGSLGTGKRAADVVIGLGFLLERLGNALDPVLNGLDQNGGVVREQGVRCG